MKKTVIAAGILALGAGSIAGIIQLSKIWAKPAKQAPSGPVISDPRWNQLTAELEAKVHRYPGRISVYLKDLHTTREWAHQPDQFMPSASLIKVPIAAAVLQKVESSEISLDEQIELTRKDRKSGSGRLKWQKSGARFSVAELLFYLITESDNTAMQILVNRFGLDYFQDTFAKLGLIATNIENDGLRLSSRPVLKENYTTAREMAELLEKIYKGELISREASQSLMELMKHLKHKERLAKTLPQGWRIAHKTGLLRHACHDAGIVFSPSGDYVLVVLTWKGPDYRTTKRYISYLGKVTYRYYGGESDLADTRPSKRIRGI
ncbi:MAG: serine hydrolase [Elusimicrobia bacterium]|nr:serine hydrolase [Elusimicrobiota bacterium]